MKEKIYSYKHFYPFFQSSLLLPKSFTTLCSLDFTWTFFGQDSTHHMSYIKCSWAKCVLVCVQSSLPLCACTWVMCVCVFVRPRLERHLRALHPCEHSPCVKIKDVSCFPSPISLVSLAPSWGYHTGELCREGSLALASKHMHMPPLTYSVPSNLHAIMRFLIIWHSKIIFLMYERAWLDFSFKDFVFITSVFCYGVWSQLL